MATSPTKTPSKAKALSLDEYAEANPTHRGSVCWVCTLPPDILKQVNGALLAGSTTRRVIVDWLKTLGHARATVNKISHHKDAAGHVKP